jgi:TRAP-type mannitol/chloroaromatic compound transport system permease small subunit
VVTRALFLIDRFSALVGKTFAWLIVVLTLFISYDIITRRFIPPLSLPAWVCAFDWEYMLYGTLFMMSGAYALSRGAMVRADMWYRTWPVRQQATIDLALFFLFFLPGIIALIGPGWDFAVQALRVLERSPNCPNGPFVWPFKFVIPIAGAFVLLQGVAEIIRCGEAILTGQWPLRYSDVEETETRLAQESQL